MIFHDDATPEDVTSKTVSLLRSAADQVGKADRGYTKTQLSDMRSAVDQLTAALDLKERMNANLP